MDSKNGLNLSDDKYKEIVNLLSRKAQSSFMGAFILLDFQSKTRYNSSFIELLINNPENACILAHEVLGEQFVLLIKSILQGQEFEAIKDFILNSCRTYTSSS